MKANFCSALSLSLSLFSFLVVLEDGGTLFFLSFFSFFFLFHCTRVRRYESKTKHGEECLECLRREGEGYLSPCFVLGQVSWQTRGCSR